MDQFLQVFQTLTKKLAAVNDKLDDWKMAQDFEHSPLPKDTIEAIQEFSTLQQQIFLYTNQLAYFFFREEIMFQEFLYNPEQIIEDPLFKYEKHPLRLKEAQSLHLLHQYSWYQVLKKMAQLDPVKGALVFLLPPSGAKDELTQPDYLPECILMEAGLYEEQALFFCWHVRLPEVEELRVGDGESLSCLYDFMMANTTEDKRVEYPEYLREIQENLEEMKNEKGGFKNNSSFTGSRKSESKHVYFLYWTEFYVYMCTLNRAELEETIPTRVRKNSMIPLNTVFCEATQYRKFRLTVEEEQKLVELDEK